MEEKSMKKTYTTRNNDKHSMEKPNGLHEAAAVSKKSPRNSYDIEVHPISFHGSSVLWDSDSDLGSKSREKKAYPLPQPSASSCRASMESHQRGSSFGSERVSVSSFTSNESSSSDDDDIHGDFSSFRGEKKFHYNKMKITSVLHSRHNPRTSQLSTPIENPKAKILAFKEQALLSLGLG
ncbi:hypothetical protein V6Z12_D02G088600 [Gossypium hirsutum]